MTRRIVVTGGSGFIGSHVVRSLRQTGADVTVVDLVRPADGDVPFVEVDLLAIGAAERAIEPGTDAIVHLAAATSVLRSVNRPAETYAINVAATAALLERARRCEVKTFVFASTNAVVGAAHRLPIDEQTELAPLTPYGATKAAAEMLLSAYRAAYGMRCARLRFTNVYGPAMEHKDSIVARLVRSARSGATFEVYGDGRGVRDYLYVDDAVAAVRLSLADTRVEGPVVVGSGRSTSVLDLIGAVGEIAGVEMSIRHGRAKVGEMENVVVDPSRARSLGWQPVVTLHDGLANVWQTWAAGAAGEKPPARLPA